MKALVYSGTMQSEIREMALADVGAGEVIVDVHQCGICGSDMHAWHGLDERRTPPLILGHEAVGTARSGRFAGPPSYGTGRGSGSATCLGCRRRSAGVQS